MVVLATHDGLGDPITVEISAIPVSVHILGLHQALVTIEEALLVGETLGSVLQVDNYKVRIRRGDLVRVCIRQTLTNPVKQVFPLTEFEFSPRVAAMLRFRYNRIVGFRKPCGLLEHGLNCCGSLVAAAVEEVSNPSSNPNPNVPCLLVLHLGFLLKM